MADKGLLLANLGTPKANDVRSVKTYLREFLTDRRVIDLPWYVRYPLVYGLIVPTRARKSAHAYQAIWTEQGSPLLTHSLNLAAELQKQVGDQFRVALGMRYGTPSIHDAVDELKDCESITFLPLYPQYSSSATGSSIEEVMRILAKQEVIPSLKIIRDFHQHPSYINAQVQTIKSHWDEKSHLLFSFHGVPERHILKSGCSSICVGVCPINSRANQGCYKAQCHNTVRLVTEQMGLNPEQYSTAFQSRLGAIPWIKPYTDELLNDLAAQGVKNLTVACPSFVVDCLETIEEIGLRAREQWLELGGKEFTLIPCMNQDPQWIKALVDLTQI